MIAAPPAALLPLDASLQPIVGNLEGLDLDGLRRQWRAHLGGEPPTHLSRWLLMKVLAYRIQSDAFGDLDKSIRRVLRSGEEDGVGAPFDRRAPQTREGVGLKAGALLVGQTATLETESRSQRLSTARVAYEPQRRWNGPGRPTSAAASHGTLVLLCGRANSNLGNGILRPETFDRTRRL